MYQVSTTKYNWKKVAESIVSGNYSDYDRVKAIYLWICSNISYDLSKSIRTADECWDRKKGVCQAYCELFYRLAEAIGIKTEVILGKSKDSEGHIGDKGHSWIFAYTNGNKGILLDPTWGAGAVKNGYFERSENPLTWFHVSPEWMIFSHYPDEDTNQLLACPLSYCEFTRLPSFNELWIEYGLNAHETFASARSNNLTLPRFYNGGEGEIELLKFPKCTTLEIGKFYTFFVRMKSRRDFAIFNNKIFCKSDEWTLTEHGYGIKFMPREEGTLSINLKKPYSDKWSTIIEYRIASPSRSNWQNVESYYPGDMPELKRIQNLDIKRWNEYGISSSLLLDIVRKERVSELPAINFEGKYYVQFVSIPMDKYLRRGRTYQFVIKVSSISRWAIINEGKFHENWQSQYDGTYIMRIIPASAGKLTLSEHNHADDKYHACLMYTVV